MNVKITPNPDTFEKEIFIASAVNKPQNINLNIYKSNLNIIHWNYIAPDT